MLNSGDLNTRLVRYLNGQKLLERQMVWYFLFDGMSRSVWPWSKVFISVARFLQRLMVPCPSWSVPSMDVCPLARLNWCLQFKSSPLTCAPAISMRLSISMLKKWPVATLKSTNRFWRVNACRKTTPVRQGVKFDCRGTNLTSWWSWWKKLM